jgi:hypothetical protein
MPGASAVAEVDRLLLTLQFYAFFLTTVKDFFEQATEAVIQIAAEQPDNEGSFDQLGQARQELATDLPACLQRLTAFRQRWGLDAYDHVAPVVDNSPVLVVTSPMSGTNVASAGKAIRMEKRRRG